MEPTFNANQEDDQLAADLRDAFDLGPESTGFEIELGGEAASVCSHR